MSSLLPGDRRQLRSSGPLVPVLACVALVIALGWQVVLQGPVTRLDQAVTMYLAAARQEWLTAVMLWIADAHDTLKLLAMTALLAAWRYCRRDHASLRLLAVIPVGMLLNVTLKWLFQRPRPALTEPLVQLATSSFPSGHAVASTVFYGTLCALVFARARSPVLRALAAVGAAVMVLLVCFGRVYLGAHYLSDVLAGVAVGIACLLLFGRLLLRGRAL